MDINPVYVPILKGKEGEFAALEALQPEIRLQVMPLIEVPGVPYDYANERLAKSLEDHIAGIADRLFKCCKDGPLYIDLPWFEDEELRDGRVALQAVLTDCKVRGVSAIPVVSRTSSDKYVAAARAYAETNQTGVCVRLLVEDFGEEVDLEAVVNRLLMGVTENKCDLILDLEDLQPEAARAVLVARSVLLTFPQQNTWRRIILAAASFPEDLSDVDASAMTTLPRRDWELWKTLQKRPERLPRRDIIFGDYTIAHPFPKEIDPRTMRMSASIRYTTADDWLIVKGKNVRQYGFDQYFQLCQALVARPEYRGKEFSWGDNYIFECAAGNTGPGNATTWRKVGTNHHITMVVQEIASSDLVA